jgi:hypothetical protein
MLTKHFWSYRRCQIPYIKEQQRERFKKVIDEVFDVHVLNEGELNYLITCICQIYQVEHKESYAVHNQIMGVLECVKQEWYRKQTVPYEIRKESENGGVNVREK